MNGTVVFDYLVSYVPSVPCVPEIFRKPGKLKYIISHCCPGKMAMRENRDGLPAKHTKHTKGSSFPRLPRARRRSPRPPRMPPQGKPAFPRRPSGRPRAPLHVARGAGVSADWKVVEHGMAGEDGGRGADGRTRQTAQDERHALSLRRRMSRHLRLVTERLHLPAQVVCFLRISRASREILTGQL